ncbi:MAG: hypothetical protein HW398_1194 [Acidobacteria bacterium]|nr:hypothetical protein [Acidobacteriota bacterium]
MPEWVNPLDARHGSPPGQGARLFFDGKHPGLEPRDQFVASPRNAERLSDAPDVGPDVRQSVRLQGNDLGPRADEGSHGFFHVPQADGADFALGLGHDVRRLEGSEQAGIHAIDAQRLFQDFLHLTVNLGAGGSDAKFRRRADRQALDGRWVIAFVRTPDQELLHPERADDLGAAGNQGNYPHRSSVPFYPLRNSRNPPATCGILNFPQDSRCNRGLLFRIQ